MRIGRRRRGQAVETVPAEAEHDPIRAFCEWALQRAEGICWVAAAGGLDDTVAALAADLPELRRSNVRWSGAGVLQDSGVEWYGFEGPERAVLVFALGQEPRAATRQLGMLSALAAHAAYVVAGGTMPALLARELAGTRGVPVWQIAGLARLAPGGLEEPGFPTLAA